MAHLDDEELKAIRELLDVEIDEKLNNKLDEKLSHLSTKHEFYNKMDAVMNGYLQTA